MKVVIKAVHLQSREYDVVRRLSSPPLQGQPMNHCIRESYNNLFGCLGVYSHSYVSYMRSY